MKKTVLSAIVLAVSTSVSVSLLAAPMDSKGAKNPFVQLQGEITTLNNSVASLQDQMDALVGRVDSLEQNVAANSRAIRNLKRQDSVLRRLIANNTLAISNLNSEIDTLNLEIADMQIQIDNNSGDIEAMKTDIDANKALIEVLQNAIDAANANIQSVETSLTQQLSNHQQLLDMLQAELSMLQDDLQNKQDIVDGKCPVNYAIREIHPDGSVVCDRDDGTYGNIRYYYRTIRTIFNRGYSPIRTYTCNTGDIATNMGTYFPTFRVRKVMDYTISNFGRLRLFNELPYSVSGYVYLNCIQRLVR